MHAHLCFQAWVHGGTVSHPRPGAGSSPAVSPGGWLRWRLWTALCGPGASLAGGEFVLDWCVDKTSLGGP